MKLFFCHLFVYLYVFLFFFVDLLTSNLQSGLTALSAAEFKEALKIVGVEEDQLDFVHSHLMGKIDEDGDGEVDAEEFVEILSCETFEDPTMAYLQQVFTEVKLTPPCQ